MSLRRRSPVALVVLAGVCLLAATAPAEVVQRGGVRASFTGRLTPKTLPRHRTAPISVAVGGRIAAASRSLPPQLRGIEIAINRHGRIDPTGLPVCAVDDIQPATTARALAACRGAVVGRGSFSAKVRIPQQTPFPSRGAVVAFNGVLGGRPAILAHVYGVDPVPVSYTIAFAIRPAHGTFGTLLRAELPEVTGDAGFVTGIDLELGRTYRFRGETRSYLSASCPAPESLPGAVFPFARSTFSFAGGRRLSATLTRSCRAR